MNNKENETPKDDTNGNPPKERSITEVAREIRERERLERLKAIEEAKRREERERLEYERQLRAEKVELLKRKQDYIDEPEPVSEEAKHYTFPQKIGNFFYANRWWLGIAAVFTLITVTLVVDLLGRDDPDMTVLLLADNDGLSYRTEQIADLFEQYCEDVNRDGEVLVSVYYIPCNQQNIENDFTTGVSTQLSIQLTTGNSVIVISDADADPYLSPYENMRMLNDLYPDDKNVTGFRYYLKNTSFLEKIDYDSELFGDELNGLYIGLRSINPGDDSLVLKLNEATEIAEPVFKAVIDEITE